MSYNIEQIQPEVALNGLNTTRLGYMSSSTAVPGIGSPSVAVTTANGITASALTAGATDTNGVITTTGTQNNTAATVITVTFTSAKATAPKTVMITAMNAAASAPNPAYVSSITSTGFAISVPANAAAVATPSWGYLVIG